MTNFEKRVRMARYQNTRRWVRFLRYCGYMGGMVAGLVASWFIMAVILV